MQGYRQPGEKPSVPIPVVFLISILAVTIILLVILIRSLMPHGSTQQALTENGQTTPLLHTDQETTVSADNVVLFVPKEATDLSGSFVILPREPDSFSYASEPDWLRPIVVEIQYRNKEGVHFPGITFSKPVSICFVLMPEQWADFTQRPDDYQVQYFDEQQLPYRWEALPVVTDPKEYQLCTQTGHLSIYALAVKKAEVIPITGLTSTPTVMVPTPIQTIVINTPEPRRNRQSEDNPVQPTPVVATRVVNTKPPQPTQQPTDPPATQEPPTEEPPTEPPPAATEPPPVIEPPPLTEEPPVEPPPVIDPSITEPPPL
jgi:hypothetical protein